MYVLKFDIHTNICFKSKANRNNVRRFKVWYTNICFKNKANRNNVFKEIKLIDLNSNS